MSNSKQFWLLLISISVCIVIIICAVAYIKLSPSQDKIHTYSEFVTEVEANNIAKLEISNNIARVILKEGQPFSLWFPITTARDNYIIEKDLPVVYNFSTSGVDKLSIIIAVSLLLVIIWMTLKFTNIGGSINSSKFNKSKVKFDDIAGLTEVKKEIKFAVKMLQSDYVSSDLLIKGIILYGPPGTGKTLIAKAIAGEAGVSFFSFSSSDFSSSFAGVASNRLRKIEKEAIKNSPCVVFIDEIDTIATKRGSNPSESGLIRDNNVTVNTLLNIMDGMKSKSRILFIGATNLLETLDPALLRPGRFDKQIYVNPPILKEDVKAITDLYLNNRELELNLNKDKLYSLMRGLTGAQIKYIINDSILESIDKYNDSKVRESCIQNALMKSISKGVLTEHTSDKDLKISAIHESGHVIMAMYNEREIIRTSVTAYNSGIGGYTQIIPDDNKLLNSNQVEADIMILYGGMLAEELMLGQSSIGSSSDLDKINELLSLMKRCEWVDSKKTKKLELKNKARVVLENNKENIEILTRELEDRTYLEYEDLILLVTLK